MQKLKSIMKHWQNNSKTQSSRSDIKVKLVAIAKDEAAYFNEWVYHHLYFGFDDIEIHINRTSDNSAEVLESICKNNPSVSWHKADWIDQCPPDAKKHIQFIVYNKVWDECLSQGGFTHILFLDIDEFWMPKDFSTTIKEFIAGFKPDSVISFEWLNDLGNLPKFSPIPQKLGGNLSPLVKTLFPIDTPVRELRHHVPLFAAPQNHILADGRPFSARKSLIQAVADELQSLKDAFVYHRAHRSVEEYISLLYRGRPGETFPYKTNRHGLPIPNNWFVEVDFPESSYMQYAASYRDFLVSNGNPEQLDKAKGYVEQRFNDSMSQLPAFVEKDYPTMMQMFRGVYQHQVVEVFGRHRAKLVAEQPGDFRLIRDLAIDASSQSIDEAISLMELAHQLHPEGPVINKKLIEFKKIKASQEGS